MAGKSFFIDTTRCTACRGCQIACKNWNQNGASMTKNTGSHQNPPDLDANTYKLVRFSEVEKDGKLAWYFFADQCRHCIDPPCKDAIEGYVSDAVIHDEKTGAVVYNEKTKEANFDEVKGACPYDIPRQAEGGAIVKCTMCLDRVSAGLLPACVKVCPTGTMNFGERDEMLAMANKRLEEVKKKFPDAQLINPDEIRVIYLVVDDPRAYHEFAIASASQGINRKLAMRGMVKPAGRALRAFIPG
ncbi:MAG: 4Fe-4S dicluster domain-containing protein [Desulforhabdus sp.]|jgi:formate dehydrogenase iron-sulfur subunit|nr:4Fe-4S dicluster domain-containing protein [Desulforhabdus sp.]